MINKQVTDVPISSITIGARYRKDMGDLQSLADSIREVGLLQPIGISIENMLVFGHRRLLAARDILGWEKIPCVTVNLASILAGEYVENEIRKDFTVSERVAIKKAVDAEEKAKAKERRKESGKVHGRGRKVVQNSAQPNRGHSRTISARRAGLGSHDTATKATKVVDHGSKELIEAMDKEVVSVNAAATIVDIEQRDPPKAQQILADAARGIKPKLRTPRSTPQSCSHDSNGDDAIAPCGTVRERARPTHKYFQKALRRVAKMNRVVAISDIAAMVQEECGDAMSVGFIHSVLYKLSYANGFTITPCKGGMRVTTDVPLDAEKLLDTIQEIKRRCIAARQSLVRGNSVNFDFDIARETIEFVLAQLEGL